MTDATPNTTKAAIRQPVPPASRQATNTGTRTSRTTVSALAMLTSPGGRQHARPSGSPQPGRSAPAGRSVHPAGQRIPGLAGAPAAVTRARHQVHPLGPGRPGADDSPAASGAADRTVVAPSTSGAWCAARPLVTARRRCGSSMSTSTVSPTPLGGTLGHELVGQAREILDPAGDLASGQRARPARRPRCRPRRSSRRRRSRPSRASDRKCCSSATSASVSPGKPTMKLDRTPASGHAPPDLVEQRRRTARRRRSGAWRAAPARWRAGTTGRSTGPRPGWRSSPRPAPAAARRAAGS